MSSNIELLHAGPSKLGDSLWKFSDKPSKFFSKNLLSFVPHEESELLSAAFSKNTWSCMQSALNCYKECLSLSDQNISFSQSDISHFIHWCYYSRNLKHSTITSYLASLSSLCKIRKFSDEAFKSYTTKCLLKGVRNLESIHCPKLSNRYTFTLPRLKILGHQIASSSLPKDDQRVFWSACIILFWGSLCVGEILSQSDANFDPVTTLLWDDVSFIDGSVRLKIRFPKVFAPLGVCVDLFPIQDPPLCPVECFRNLSSYKKTIIKHLPVFMFNSGKLLTPQSLNELIGSSLKPL
jgi:hypothetical protein